MSIKFNDFDFEVIDIGCQRAAELTINQNGLNVSKKVAATFFEEDKAVAFYLDTANEFELYNVKSFSKKVND